MIIIENLIWWKQSTTTQKQKPCYLKKTITAGLVEVIIYSSPDDKKKNRGFCFLEYESHKAASLAKRRLGTGRIKVWPTEQRGTRKSDSDVACSCELYCCFSFPPSGMELWYNSRLGRPTGGTGRTNDEQGQSIIRTKPNTRHERRKTEGKITPHLSATEIPATGSLFTMLFIPFIISYRKASNSSAVLSEWRKLKTTHLFTSRIATMP